MAAITPIRSIALHALGLALGDADAHVREVGGNNHGPDIDFMLQTVGAPPGSPWCAAAIYKWMLKAYCQMRGLLTASTDEGNRQIMLANVHKFSAETGIPGTGYCPSVMAGAVDQGRWHGPDFTPSAGDLVLYDWKGEGSPHHIGFVRSATADTVSTVEGNTSSGITGSQADGDGVFRRTRPRTHVFGFVHF